MESNASETTSDTSKMTGFKGKRSTRKFGRNGKNGGADRKSIASHQSSNLGPPELQPVIDAANDDVVLDPIPLRRERVAARKETNSELAQKLRATTRQYHRETREKEAVQMQHDHVAKNNIKLKKDMASLCNVVRESRAETRCLKNELSNAEKSNKIMENRLVSCEWEHSQALAERDKLNTAELMMQEKAHSDNMKQKEQEKTALIQASDKKRRKLENKFHTKLAAKDRQCNNIITRNNRTNEQLVLDVETIANAKLSEAKAEVKLAHNEIRALTLKSALLLEQQKVRHKESLRALQKDHDIAARRKNAKVKAMHEEVEGMHEMMYEMLDEVKEAMQSKKAASSDTVAAQNKFLSQMRKVQTMTLVCSELKDEIADEYNKNAELQAKVDEYESIINTMQKEYEEKVDEYDSIIAYMDGYYEDTISELQPRFIMKHWVKNKTRGAHAEWLPEVDKLIMEMLANRTPPTCIQANIYAMAQVIHPTINVVKELPCVKHIKNLRTVLSYNTKALAAYRLGNAKVWNQLHTDETARRQSSIVNVVISILECDNQLKTICLSGSIIPVDGTAEEQSRAIIASLHESGKLLKEWREMTARMYPEDIELLDTIPKPVDLSPTKLLGGYISHDNCATANLTGDILCDKIIQAGKDAGLNEAELVLYQGHCFQHLRNTWFGAIEKFLSNKLSTDLKEDMDEIPSQFRVAKTIAELLFQVDKEYNLTANYAKGHGSAFQDWKERYRPGKRYLPPTRVLGGTRQDSSFEGALPVYDGRADMLMFTNECLYSSDNLLQRCLFIALGCMEVIAVLRVASILFLAVVVPLRWLSGNTHLLMDYGWGERDMGRAVQLLYNAFQSIQDDGSLLLDHDYIMNIFSPLYADIPPFQEYLDYYLREKEGNVVGSGAAEDRVLPIDEAMAEIFWPQRVENRQTTEYCHELAVGIAMTLLTELTDPKKSTHKYINDGTLAYKNLSQKEKDASLGKRANNDPSEGTFATFTDVLCTSNCISLGSAAGIGQARYNKDMNRNHHKMVTGRKSKTTKASTELENGIFHCIHEKLQNSLLKSGKTNSKRDRKRLQRALEEQRAQRTKKIEAGLSLKIKAAERDFITISYFHQQYSPPRCWKTVRQALDEFEQLGSKAAKLKCVREQILIRYIGLGWVSAHHPWSTHKYQYLPTELLQHLCEVVIPLQDTEEVPIEAPINLPQHSVNYTMGTASADLVALYKTSLDKENSIRLRAMIERDRLENSGFGDQLYELQQTSWAIEKIRAGSFKLDMCFMYNDDSNDILQWCQGTISRIVREKNNCIWVDVEWDKECLKQGDAGKTTERLMKSKWNPTTHEHGSWRENLLHLTKTAHDIQLTL